MKIKIKYVGLEICDYIWMTESDFNYLVTSMLSGSRFVLVGDVDGKKYYINLDNVAYITKEV